jgi:5-methylcytosine-specific restriction endonuclease McrA
MTKKIDDKFRYSFVKRWLRRASLVWPPRNECKKQARRDRGFYECALCKKCFGGKEVHIDHIIPAVDMHGFQSWDDLIQKLFPDVSGLQCLCVPCHAAKSLIETEHRKLLRKKKK